MTILAAGFLAGILDITLAIMILAKGNTAGTLRYIAKGAFGPLVYEAGDQALWAGGAIHFIIATTFAALYVFIFPFLGILRNQRIVSGLLYGLMIWGIMRFLVLPMTYTPPPPFGTSTIKTIGILMIAVGLPISFITHRHYSYRDS